MDRRFNVFIYVLNLEAVLKNGKKTAKQEFIQTFNNIKPREIFSIFKYIVRSLYKFVRMRFLRSGNIF